MLRNRKEEGKLKQKSALLKDCEFNVHGKSSKEKEGPSGAFQIKTESGSMLSG